MATEDPTLESLCYAVRRAAKDLREATAFVDDATLQYREAQQAAGQAKQEYDAAKARLDRYIETGVV